MNPHESHVYWLGGNHEDAGRSYRCPGRSAAKGDGETWEDYAHRLEGRIKRQREEIDSLQALRGYPASKHDRKRIVQLERLVGRQALRLEMQDAGLRALHEKSPRHSEAADGP